MDYTKFIGQPVLHVWRLNQIGILTSVLDGCNTLLGVKWPGCNHVVYMSPQDIALVSTYPSSRWG